MNSVPKSVRTCHFTEVRGMYLISKALRMAPHLAILLVVNASEYGFKRELSKNDDCMCLEVMG